MDLTVVTTHILSQSAAKYLDLAYHTAFDDLPVGTFSCEFCFLAQSQD